MRKHLPWLNFILAVLVVMGIYSSNFCYYETLRMGARIAGFEGIKFFGVDVFGITVCWQVVLVLFVILLALYVFTTVRLVSDIQKSKTERRKLLSLIPCLVCVLGMFIFESFEREYDCSVVFIGAEGLAPYPILDHSYYDAEEGIIYLEDGFAVHADQNAGAVYQSLIQNENLTYLFLTYRKNIFLPSPRVTAIRAGGVGITKRSLDKDPFKLKIGNLWVVYRSTGVPQYRTRFQSSVDLHLLPSWIMSRK